MPMYVYGCGECGYVETLIRKVDERDQPRECVKCGAVTKRQATTATPHFKGTDWYCTDFKHKK